MRRLLLCSPTFWPEPVGTPRYATDAARWFRDRGWEVIVVTSQPFYPDFVRYPGWGRHRRLDEFDGIPIHRLPTIVPPGGRALGRMAGDANFGLQVLLSGLVRRLPRPDAVLTFSPGVPLAVPAAKGFRSFGPHVVVVHDVLSGLASATGMAQGLSLAAMRRMERASLGVADHRVVLSDEMGDSLLDMGVTGSTSVVPIWADVHGAEELALPCTDAFTAGYSGNFGRKQGIGLLLDAASELTSTGITVRLRGRGPLRSLAERRADQLPSLELVDFVPSEQLAASLREVDLHLVPQGAGTGHHSMPSKVINIFASGRPLMAICEPDGPLYSLSEKGLALWAPPDPAAVAAAVQRVQEDPTEARKCAERAMAHVREHHDRDRLLGRIEQLLSP